MTNKEFFLKVIASEQPIFIKVLKAVPDAKLDFKPDEKARTVRSLVSQLSGQAAFILSAATKGSPDWDGSKSEKKPTVSEMVEAAEKNYDALKKGLASVSDDDWENGDAKMGAWQTKKYDMAWGFLFDAIHHRGQLSTYLRAMGEKVPSIYGGSADEPMTM